MNDIKITTDKKLQHMTIQDSITKLIKTRQYKASNKTGHDLLGSDITYTTKFTQAQDPNLQKHDKTHKQTKMLIYTRRTRPKFTQARQDPNLHKHDKTLICTSTGDHKRDQESTTEL